MVGVRSKYVWLQVAVTQCKKVTFGSIAQQLSLLGCKITPYELIKYNCKLICSAFDQVKFLLSQQFVVSTGKVSSTLWSCILSLSCRTKV